MVVSDIGHCHRCVDDGGGEVVVVVVSSTQVVG